MARELLGHLGSRNKLGTTVRKALRSIGLSTFAAAMMVPAASHADAFRMCLSAKTAFEKIDRCSIVILHTRQARQLERAYLRRGNAFMEINRFADAANDFTAAIQINPKVAGYYDNRQSALKSMGRIRDALNDANTTIRLAPTYAFGYRSRGNVYDAMGRYDQAIADYGKAISIDQSNAGLLIDRGKILSKSGRLNEAIADFTHALDIDGNAMAALRERGLTYKKIGNFVAALADLTWYARFQPQDEEVFRAIEELRQIESPTIVQPDSRQPPRQAEHEKGDPSGDKIRMLFGSGFFVSPDGFVVTNAHVVRNCSNIQLVPGMASPVSARILALDTANDLALLKGNLTVTRTAALRTAVKIGEGIAAFGYPLVGLLSTGGNFTVGNVSAVAGLGDDTRYIQISAPVQPGNSGGPLLDQSGNVVGVVVSKLDAIRLAAATDDLAQNVNFAIKASVLMGFLDAKGVTYSVGTMGKPISSEDLAERAKSISILIKCAN